MYAGLQNTAAKMLAKFGRSVNLTKTVPGTFDPTTGTSSGNTTTTEDVSAVFVGISQKWKDKFVIEQGDSVALVAADGLEPEQNDVLDGWTILAVEAVKPADTAVLFKCHVRKQ
jgi:hypothetical protein